VLVLRRPVSDEDGRCTLGRALEEEAPRLGGATWVGREPLEDPVLVVRRAAFVGVAVRDVERDEAAPEVFPLVGAADGRLTRVGPWLNAGTLSAKVATTEAKMRVYFWRDMAWLS